MGARRDGFGGEGGNMGGAGTCCCQRAVQVHLYAMAVAMEMDITKFAGGLS